MHHKRRDKSWKRSMVSKFILPPLRDAHRIVHRHFQEGRERVRLIMWTRRFGTSLALLASSTKRTRAAVAFTSSPSSVYGRLSSRPLIQVHGLVVSRNPITQQQMSFFGAQAEGGIQRIDRAAMTEIIEDVVNSSRDESGYIIIDVRGHDEIQQTGKLSDVVETLPLPYIAQGAFAMEEEDFKEAFGFEKPGMDETLVFTCKAGIRSQQAGQLAKMAGYSNIIDYAGGANEWFS